MHRIVPDLIIQKYKEGQYEGSFEAAGLFVDISGFSTLTDALMGQGREGAEALAVMMGEVFDPIVEAIFRYGGIITGYAGDSINALYPVETDLREATQRALASAAAIQSGREEKPVFATPHGEFKISAKIGLGAGGVAWGILRSEQGDKAIYYFRGEAVDEAARAEHRALAGDVVLSKRVCNMLDEQVEAEPLADAYLVKRQKSPSPAMRELSFAPADLATSSVFVPPEVLTHELQGEFRQTPVLFAQIPELEVEELEAFARTVHDLRRQYGGLIDRLDFGDKGCTLMIVWGAPVAHENDIDRALSFALELQNRANLPVTAGITYYMSYAGFVGGKLYESYTAYGWGVNLAARFMMNAAKNSIWLDERIYQRMKDRYYADFVAEQSFKGFVQKQNVYLLRGRKSGADAFFHGRMVGRERELEALAEFVAPLWAGKYAGVLGIWGDAGMGKSRLVYEFRRSHVFDGHACLWARCQCDEIVRRSLNPFRNWLTRYFDILPTQDQSTRMLHFVARMDALIARMGKSALAGDLQRGRAFLAQLIEVEWPDALAEQMDAQARYDSTVSGLISLLKAESLHQPLIVFIEDGQYLDDDSIAFILRLKRSLQADPASHPIAILVATRWQGTKILMDDGLVERNIDLGALDPDSIATLCADHLGQPASTELIRLINERSEGNPFFTEQILRYMQEQGLVELGTSGTWGIRARTRSALLPADISAMLLARLDTLPPRVKEVIQAASVLGRVFDLPVLRRMLLPASDVQSGISAAEQAGIWSPLNETRYIFNHALLREMAYSMQLRSRREQLHAQAYRALSEQFGAEANRHYAELAHHCEQGALVAEARQLLELAGDGARDEYQNTQALDLYRRALALLSETALPDRYRLHRECEKIVAELGRTDERRAEIDAMDSLARSMGAAEHDAEVLLLRSRLVLSEGEYAQSEELAAKALERAVTSGSQELEIRAYLNLEDAARLRGMYMAAAEYGEAGLALARKSNRHMLEGSLLNMLGLTYLEMRNPSAARTYFDECLSIFRVQGNLRGVTLALTNSGNVAAYQGNYHAAMDYDEQAIRLAREIGESRLECALLSNLGWICSLQGDYSKAQSYAERSLPIAKEIGDLHIQTLTLINLSSYAGGRGDFDEAIESAERGLALARRSADRNAQGWALTYLGHGLCEAGRLAEAVEAYREALEIRQELGQAVLGTEPAAGLAAASWLQGESEAARDYAESVLVQLEQDGTLEGTDRPLQVYLRSYQILEALGDPRAESTLNRAHDLLRQRANGFSDPSARKRFLEEIPYNREIMSRWQARHARAY